MFRAPRTLSLVGVPMLAMTMACTGQISGKPGGSKTAGPGQTSDPGIDDPGMTPGPKPDPMTGKPPVTTDPTPNTDPPSTIPEVKKCVSGKPGPRMLRRLTAEQLDNTVRDLFRNASAPKSDVFNDPQVLGFTGDAAALVVRDLTSQQLMIYAEQVASWAATNVADVSPCKDMTPACRTQFIKSFGQRAFRQPLNDVTVARYEGLFASGTTFQEGLQLTISAMLQSPYFLYRRELGEPDPANPGQVKLTPWEVATNIAYLITRSTPDDTLLQAAAQNQLSTRAQIDTQVERLLMDPKNRGTMDTFMGEWLETKRVAGVLKDPKTFDFTDALRDDMAKETAALIDDVVFTRKGSLKDLLTAPYTFVNANLAKHYGIAGVTGDALSKVDAPHDPGILVQGSMMAGHGGMIFSSPTLRGKLVRTRLLCESLPPPPPNVNTNIQPASDLKTTRQIFQRHVDSPSCSPCHSMMDPIGFAFENYDVAGRFRTEENGVAIDASGEILGDDFTFKNLKELNGFLADNAGVRECMVRFMSYFAYGATNWADDGCTRDAITTEAEAANWSIHGVLTAITHAPHFTQRVQ